MVMEMKSIKEKILKLQKHGMTGVSYMGPVFTMAALSKVIAIFLIARGFYYVGDFFGQFASILYSFIFPVFSMFVAYSIADKPGLIPGFVIGWLSSNTIGNIPRSGILGALIFSIIAGYVVKYAAEKIEFKDLYNSVVPTFIIPLITTILLVPVYLFFAGTIFNPLNMLLIKVVDSSGIIGQVIYSIITAVAIASDLGGPINKTAILFGTLLSAEMIIPMTAINLAIVIPPIGIGLSTIIDIFFKKHGVYDEDMKEMGKDSIKLGLIGISEGGLPFLYAKPKETSIVNMIGAVAGSVVAITLGAKQWLPIPAIWGWLMAENVPAYVIGLIVGVIVTAAGNVIIRLRD